VRPVRPVRHPPDPVLPLAEGVLRERSRCLRAHRQTPQNPRRGQGPPDRCPGGKTPAEERSPGRGHAGERAAKQRTWGPLKGVWVPHDTCDQLVDFVNRWSSKTGIAVLSFLLWIGLAPSKWHNWKGRYGKANEHNAWVPRDHWVDEAEKQAIVAFHERHPLEGYRRLTFMMLEADVVAASPSSVYRLLKAAGVLERHNVQPSVKGKGFVQPLRPHEHWHVDVSYWNIGGTFYFLCSILDGCSRFIVHWGGRGTMLGGGGGKIIQGARGEVPRGATPIIFDNGTQVIATGY